MICYSCVIIHSKVGFKLQNGHLYHFGSHRSSALKLYLVLEEVDIQTISDT